MSCRNKEIYYSYKFLCWVWKCLKKKAVYIITDFSDKLVIKDTTILVNNCRSPHLECLKIVGYQNTIIQQRQLTMQSKIHLSTLKTILHQAIKSKWASPSSILLIAFKYLQLFNCGQKISQLQNKNPSLYCGKKRNCFIYSLQCKWVLENIDVAGRSSEPSKRVFYQSSVTKDLFTFKSEMFTWNWEHKVQLRAITSAHKKKLSCHLCMMRSDLLLSE